MRSHYCARLHLQGFSTDHGRNQSEEIVRRLKDQISDLETLCPGTGKTDARSLYSGTRVGIPSEPQMLFARSDIKFASKMINYSPKCYLRPEYSILKTATNASLESCTALRSLSLICCWDLQFLINSRSASHCSPHLIPSPHCSCRRRMAAGNPQRFEGHE